MLAPSTLMLRVTVFTSAPAIVKVTSRFHLPWPAGVTVRRKSPLTPFEELDQSPAYLPPISAPARAGGPTTHASPIAISSIVRMAVTISQPRAGCLRLPGFGLADRRGGKLDSHHQAGLHVTRVDAALVQSDGAARDGESESHAAGCAAAVAFHPIER